MMELERQRLAFPEDLEFQLEMEKFKRQNLLIGILLRVIW